MNKVRFLFIIEREKKDIYDYLYMRNILFLIEKCVY